MLPYFFLTVLSSPHSLLTTPAFLIRACCLLSCLGPSSFPVAQTVKHLPIMQEIQVQSLGREDFLEKEMAPHSSVFAWKIPWMEESGRLQSMGLQRVGHDWATSLGLGLCNKGRACQNGSKRWFWVICLSHSYSIAWIPSHLVQHMESW